MGNANPASAHSHLPTTGISKYLPKIAHKQKQKFQIELPLKSFTRGICPL